MNYILKKYGVSKIDLKTKENYPYRHKTENL